MARELSIVYGAVTMGEASSAFYLTGKYRETEAPFQKTYSWTVIVRGTSESDFKTQCLALEAAFATRFSTLTITFGSQAHASYTHSANTGFNHQPFCRKVGGVADTGRSREYECGVTVELPADDNTGRRSSTVTVEQDASDRRTITIQVQYTAQGGNSAVANYLAKIGAFRSAILATVGGTYNTPTTTRYAHDDQNKIVDVTQMMHEIIYNESAAGADHASIKEAVVEYRRTNPAPEFSPGGPYGDVSRMQEVAASFSCNVPHDVTSDLNGLWEDVLRPYLLTEARRFFDAAIAIVVSDEPVLVASGNVVSGVLRLLILTKGTKALAYTARQEIDANPGKFFVPRWDGDRFSGYVYQGPASCTRTTTVTFRAIDQPPFGTVQGVAYASGATAQSGSALTPGGGPVGGWLLLRVRLGVTPLRMGLVELGEPLLVSDQTKTFIEIWVSPRGATSSPTTQPSGPASSPGTIFPPTTAPSNAIAGSPIYSAPRAGDATPASAPVGVFGGGTVAAGLR